MSTKRLIIAAATAALLATPALAQGGGGGGRFGGGQGGQGRFGGQGFTQLSEEERNTSWKLQAQSVADRINLEDEPADKLTEIYAQARAKHHEGFAEIREEMMEEFRRMRESGDFGGGGGRGGDRGGGAGGGQRGGGGAGGAGGGGGFRGGGGGGGGFAFPMQERMQEFNTEHRDALKARLAEFLTDEQLKDAIAPLGSFNTQWDRATHGVAELEIDEFTQLIILDALLDYINTTTMARQSGDFEALREVMTEARDELREAVSELLSEEQMRDLNRSLGGGRRGGRGG